MPATVLPGSEEQCRGYEMGNGWDLTQCQEPFELRSEGFAPTPKVRVEEGTIPGRWNSMCKDSEERGTTVLQFRDL